MTQLVFALVTTLGTQTISTEYFSGINTCLYYRDKLNTNHPYHHKHTKAEHVHAVCLPARVDPSLQQVFDY